MTLSSGSGSRRNLLSSVARQDAELIAEFREYLTALRRGAGPVPNHVRLTRVL